MKYRLTPFHLVSLIFLFQGIRDSIIVAKAGDKAELGALLPFIYFSLFLGTLLFDLLIQFIISISIKSNARKILYLTQILIIALIGISMFPTVHHTG